jgi:glycosyltransferase involved in cell wall biosynthesis
VFLEALARLIMEGREVHGVLLGDALHDTGSAYLTLLENMARQSPLEGHVTFLGHRDDPQVALAAADVLVVPSYAEPFGLVILEAFALGVPVVATAAGGHPEVIRHGVNGFLVPPDDPCALATSIGRLLQDRELYSRITQQARSRVLSDFAPECFNARVASLYAGILPAERCPTIGLETRVERPER